MEFKRHSIKIERLGENIEQMWNAVKTERHGIDVVSSDPHARVKYVMGLWVCVLRKVACPPCDMWVWQENASSWLLSNKGLSSEIARSSAKLRLRRWFFYFPHISLVSTNFLNWKSSQTTSPPFEKCCEIKTVKRILVPRLSHAYDRH